MMPYIHILVFFLGQNATIYTHFGRFFGSKCYHIYTFGFFLGSKCYHMYTFWEGFGVKMLPYIHISGI